MKFVLFVETTWLSEAQFAVYSDGFGDAGLELLPSALPPGASTVERWVVEAACPMEAMDKFEDLRGKLRLQHVLPCTKIIQHSVQEGALDNDQFDLQVEPLLTALLAKCAELDVPVSCLFQPRSVLDPSQRAAKLYLAAWVPADAHPLFTGLSQTHADHMVAAPKEPAHVESGRAV